MPECRGGLPERCGAYGLYRDTEQISFSNPDDAWPFWREGVDIACIPVECGVMVCAMAGGAGAKIGGLLVGFMIWGVITRWWPWKTPLKSDPGLPVSCHGVTRKPANYYHRCRLQAGICSLPARGCGPAYPLAGRGSAPVNLYHDT